MLTCFCPSKLNNTIETVFQRFLQFPVYQVQVEVEAMDKGGNFIGWLYVDGVNLSIALVEEGLAKVHFTAERSSHYKALQQAEAKAKSRKLNVRTNLYIKW